MPDDELVTTGYVSTFYVCKIWLNSSGRIECNFRFVEVGVRMGWTVSKSRPTLVDEVSDRFNIKGVVQI
jgi:hypothetical protein